MWYNIFCSVVNIFGQKCRSGGTADATDSKSVGGNFVWVQIPPAAVFRKKGTGFCLCLFCFIGK